MKHLLDHQDFVHSDFPEPIKAVKGIEVRYWDHAYAMDLLKKHFPRVYAKITSQRPIDYEV